MSVEALDKSLLTMETTASLDGLSEGSTTASGGGQGTTGHGDDCKAKGGARVYEVAEIDIARLFLLVK